MTDLKTKKRGSVLRLNIPWDETKPEEARAMQFFSRLSHGQPSALAKRILLGFIPPVSNDSDDAEMYYYALGKLFGAPQEEINKAAIQAMQQFYRIGATISQFQDERSVQSLPIEMSHVEPVSVKTVEPLSDSKPVNTMPAAKSTAPGNTGKPSTLGGGLIGEDKW